jgi:poly-gamma-glutamate capsule biosynthesis protein CapA/YwtB (metallophosphatase superfamily)
MLHATRSAVVAAATAKAADLHATIAGASRIAYRGGQPVRAAILDSERAELVGRARLQFTRRDSVTVALVDVLRRRLDAEGVFAGASLDLDAEDALYDEAGLAELERLFATGADAAVGT